MEGILKAERVPDVLSIEKTKTNDSFFEACAVGLKKIKPKSNVSIKTLRLDCKNQAMMQMETNEENLLSKLQIRANFTNIRDYIQTVDLVPEKAKKLGIKEPIMGMPEIEGFFIAQKYDVELHVINYNKVRNTCIHKLINSKETKEINKTEVPYTSKNSIHLIQLELNEFNVLVKRREPNKISTANMNKRMGTTNEGLDYETGISAVMAAKCALNEEIKDFTMNSNLKDYGALDDIILTINLNNGEKDLFLIQLKHKQNPVDILDAIGEGGMFNLKKYEESYIKLKRKLDNEHYNNIHIILFTNCTLTGEKPSHIVSYTDNTFRTNLIKTTPVTKFCKITSGYDQNFLSKLLIVSEQINANEINEYLKKEIATHFDNPLEPVGIEQLVLDNFQKHIKLWNKETISITRSQTRSLFFENMLSLYVLNIVTEIRQTNSAIAVETFNHFNCTVIHKNNSETILFAMYDYLRKQFKFDTLKFKTFSASTKEIFDELLKFDKYKKHFEEINKVNGDLSIKDLYIVMFRLKECPLIVKYDDQNKYIIDSVVTKMNDIYENRSLILVKEENCEIESYNNSFINLYNLIGKNPELYQKNIEHIQLTFTDEKHKINLKSLVSFSTESNIVIKIDADAYVKLISETICIGQKCDIPNYYVERSLRLPIVDATVFNEIDLFLIINASETDSFFKLKNVLNSNATLEETKQLALSIYKMTKRYCHVLNKIDNNTFLITYTRGSIKNISKHQIKNRYPNKSLEKEEEFLNYLNENRKQILSCDAGTGKSTFLKKIQNLESKEHLSIYINLAKHASIIKEINDLKDGNDINIILEILEQNSKHTFEFQKIVVMELLKSGNITWLVDGFDEVNTINIHGFLNCIKNSKNKIIVATRSSKLSEIETDFDVLSLELVPFSKNDQIKFCTKYFQNKFSNEQITQHLNNLNKLEESLIGIPLQTKLCAELLEEIHDINKYEFTVIFLFEHFLKKLYKNRDPEYETRVSKLALKLFFDEQLLNTVEIYDNDFQVMIRSVKECQINDFLISGFNELNDPVFTHRSYAEYLCAKWLVKILQTETSGIVYKNIYPTIFCNSLIQVRIFFDKVVCNNLKLHTAVLNADIETVKQILKDNKDAVHEKDYFGRTAFHLAASYGKRIYLNTEDRIQGIKTEHENVVIETIEKSFNIELTTGETQPLSSNNLLDTTLIFDYLLNFETKDILEENVIEYSLRSSSFHLSNKLCKRFISSNVCSIFSNECNIILCFVAVQFHLNNLFEYIIPIIKKSFINYHFNKKNLFFVAIENENYEIIETIYDLGVSIEEICNGKTVLQFSCENGKLAAVKLLLKLGANIAKTTVDGETAIKLAEKNGHNEVVEYLKSELKEKYNISSTSLHEVVTAGNFEKCKKILDQYEDLDVKNEEGYTPLMCAAINGHLDIADFLISEGADCFLEDNSGKNSLKLAFENGHDSIINLTSLKMIFKELIEKGNVNELNHLIKLGFNIESRYDDDFTPVHLAAKRDNLDVLKLLVNSKADCKKTCLEGFTLMHMAMFSKNKNIWEYVLNLGFDLEVGTTLNSTPLQIAVSNNKLNAVNWLIEKKAKYRTLCYNKQTLLHCAAGTDNIDLLEKVYSLGFDINGKSDTGDTALHIAAHFESMNIIKWFLENGADVNILNKMGKKPEDVTTNRKIKRILRSATKNT